MIDAISECWPRRPMRQDVVLISSLSSSSTSRLARSRKTRLPPPPQRQQLANGDGASRHVYSADVLSQKLPTAPKRKGTSQDGRSHPLNSRNAEFTKSPQPIPPPPDRANRKLVRNATAELEVVSFEDAVQKITGFAAEDKGYVATSSSQKQANGKLSGQVVVKVLPDNLDRFLQKLRGIGELKNQALTTEDVTKAYFDTESRLKNARSMEQRLIEILKTKSKDVADLLAVEKELGRVREEIETMQGELKFMDSQVQFATVTIQLSEKNMNIPAAFLLKERAQLALYAPEVEKTYNDIKALASPKVQITNAQINRDNTGRVSAYVYMLIAPDESEGIISTGQGDGAGGELPSADRACRARRRRTGRECQDRARQGRAEHHHLTRGTGTGVAANIAPDSLVRCERQNEGTA